MGNTSSRLIPAPTPFTYSGRPQAVAVKVLYSKQIRISPPESGDKLKLPLAKNHAVKAPVYKQANSRFLYTIHEDADPGADEVAKWALSHAGIDPFHIVPNLEQVVNEHCHLATHFQDRRGSESASADFWARVSQRIAVAIDSLTVEQVVRTWIALEFLVQSSIRADSNRNDNSETKGVAGIHGDEGVVQIFETLALQCV
ncbi:hypothetical protein DENSPDRAFT_850692 [Dentipellis sp. KUC8613]|nr:hypothetical protein DENSPDRAFT_850692 [Dentipellis sp. KUC8613]